MKRELTRRSSGRSVGNCMVVAFASALVTATAMSAAFSFYLSHRQEGPGDQDRARLKSVTDRNALLQSELLKLNASVTGVMIGLDTVSRAVNTAKVQLQLTQPGQRGADNLKEVKEAIEQADKSQMKFMEEALANLRRENDLLKDRAAHAPSLPALPPAQIAPARGGAQQEKWLAVGIPTVPRKGGERYLEQTIRALAQQLPLRQDDPLFDRVIVVVLNNQPGKHPVFDDLKKEYQDGQYSRYFKFLEQEVSQTDNVHNPEGNSNVPGSKVRRQTRAAVAMLRASSGLAGHFIFMEDDFIFCPHALMAIQYVISKAYDYKRVGFSGIRVSYGLCGVILNGRDVREVADYLEQHQARRPPDHLISEWINAETKQAQAYLQGRNNFGYRFNILEHIGVVSSLRDARQTGWPGCYQELVYPIVFEGEAWNPKQCQSDDIWPCDEKPADYPADWILFNVQSKVGAQVDLKFGQDH